MTARNVFETEPFSPRPLVVAWLGYGGLFPFVGTALACFLDPHHGSVWLHMLLPYGAVILSFARTKLRLLKNMHRAKHGASVQWTSPATTGQALPPAHS